MRLWLVGPCQRQERGSGQFEVYTTPYAPVGHQRGWILCVGPQDRFYVYVPAGPINCGTVFLPTVGGVGVPPDWTVGASGQTASGAAGW